MLTAELVKVSRRKGGLQVVPRSGLDVARAAELLSELLEVAKQHHGLSRGELTAALDEVVVDDPKEEKALRAARKLVLDRLEFAERDDVDAVAVRAAVFAAAADARRAGAFDRAAIVAAVGKQLSALGPGGPGGVDVDAVLYADLEDAHVVDAAALPTDGALLVGEWEHKEIQALLLRASEVVVDVDATPAQVRRLLRALKLHQLLFRVVENEGLLRLVIDGPMGLFSSSTRYGMKLAVLLPHIQACTKWRLEASVQLKKGGRAESFVVSGKGGVDVVEEPLPPLVQGLIDELPALLPKCLVAPATDLLVVDGHGALVPDVVVVDKDGGKSFVEVLGFWSRDAVWKRVELVEQGKLSAPIVFCFSERLRVSEEALDDGGAALVAFKGTLSAKKVAEKLAALHATKAKNPR